MEIFSPIECWFNIDFQWLWLFVSITYIYNVLNVAFASNELQTFAASIESDTHTKNCIVITPKAISISTIRYRDIVAITSAKQTHPLKITISLYAACYMHQNSGLRERKIKIELLFCGDWLHYMMNLLLLSGPPRFFWQRGDGKLCINLTISCWQTTAWLHWILHTIQEAWNKRLSTISSDHGTIFFQALGNNSSRMIISCLKAPSMNISLW